MYILIGILIDYFRSYIRELEPKYHYKIYNKLKDDRKIIGLDFGEILEKINRKWIDVCGSTESGILYTTMFDKNTNLWKAYEAQENFSG